MSKVTVRNMRSDDFEHWNRFWQGYCEFYKTQVTEDVTRHTFAQLLDEDSSIFGVMALLGSHAEEPCGFAHCIVHPYTWGKNSICYLEDLYVDPLARGKRAGQAMIDHLIERCKKENWDKLYWMTQSNNERARKLYDHFTKADDFVRYSIKIK